MKTSEMPTDAASFAEWMKTERAKRGWSTTFLANVARSIAQREGSNFKLTQQSVSGFEQGNAQRIPEWLRFVRMAFEEGEPPKQQDTAPRDDIVYVRQVDIRYAMGDGAELADYPDTQLVPFNFGFLHRLTHAPLEKLFLASGHGDSMEPTLQRHDLLLVDTTETRITMGDAIFALEYAGAGYVKRLRSVMRDGRRRIVILSDNKEVPSEEADPADIHVVGKVIWVGRALP